MVFPPNWNPFLPWPLEHEVQATVGYLQNHLLKENNFPTGRFVCIWWNMTKRIHFHFKWDFHMTTMTTKWSASPKSQPLSLLFFPSSNSDANKCTQINCKLNSINNQIQSGNVNHTFVIIHKQIKKADNWHIPNESCQVPLPSYK